MSEQPKWLERAKQTYRFHRSKLLSAKNWTLTDTARALKRSLGPISEDLLIARWCRTHEKQLERFEYAKDALEFIKNKKKEQEIMDLD